MNEKLYTLEETNLVDLISSFSSMLEVLSVPVDYSLQYKSVRVNSKYSVDVEVFREFHDSSECKITILVRVVNSSSNLPVHVVRLTKAGYLNDKDSVRYIVYSIPYFRGNPKGDLASGRTTNMITVSDLEDVLLSGNMREDVFVALSVGAPQLLEYLFTCCGISYLKG